MYDRPDHFEIPDDTPLSNQPDRHNAYSHTSDKGCQHHSSCLSCPFSVCAKHERSRLSTVELSMIGDGDITDITYTGDCVPERVHFVYQTRYTLCT